MSGHSKWATIKRQKGAADAKRSVTFTKLAAAITVAARDGGGDLGSNFKLRLAVDKAREANMPKDNIDRAIKRGTGELGGAAFEHIVYEAYAPGGAALVIDVNTDNRNRAVANIKSILNKHNGKLAESGAVAYLFQPRGVMTVAGGDAEAMEMAIIESGADDYALSDDSAVVYTDPKEVMAVAKALETAGLTASDVEQTMEPVSTIMISDEKTAKTLVAITELLEDLDDVSSVYSNFDIDESFNIG
ncbi:MAG TPA: YebC/PmpR family DNA-binding transcriptional regulator [Patescibacteria group bacterium]